MVHLIMKIAPLGVFALRWLDALGPDRRPTWPADDPRKAIDHVFVTPHGTWHQRSARVIAEEVASDHAPVVVELELRGE